MKYRYMDNDQQDWTGSAGASNEKPQTASLVRDGHNQAVRLSTVLQTDAPLAPSSLLSDRPVIGIDPDERRDSRYSD